MNEFFTMEYLATFAGMVLSVNLLVQATKQFFEFQTKWLVLAYAIIIQTAVLFFTNKFIPDQIFLGLINAVLVAVSAMGTYNAVTNNHKTEE